MTLANQQSAMPSNKMIAMAVVTVAFHHSAGLVVPPEVLDAYGVLMQVGLALGAAWFVPDRANVPK